MATIDSRFEIRARFPTGCLPFHPLTFDWAHLAELIGPAAALTMMGSIESLLSAVVADGMIDDRHDSNQELMAQGIANFTDAIFWRRARRLA